DYQQFVNWMKERSYSYVSMLETDLSELEDELTRERYYDAVKDQLKQIHDKIRQNRNDELIRHKDQIKRLLEQDIVSRYYLEKGKVEAGIKYDQGINKAVEILHDAAQYKRILNIPG